MKKYIVIIILMRYDNEANNKIDEFIKKSIESNDKK